LEPNNPELETADRALSAVQKIFEQVAPPRPVPLAELNGRGVWRRQIGCRHHLVEWLTTLDAYNL